MDRKSVIGFALIGIILLLFSWYNTKQFEKQHQQQMTLDSLAAVAAMQNVQNDSTINAAAAAAAGEMLQGNPSEDSPMYQSEFLNEASSATEEIFTLENDKIVVDITSKGAQPYRVKVKDYYKFDSTELVLLSPDKSRFDLEINANQWINTEDLYFKTISHSASDLTMRLYFDEDSYIQSTYSLADGSYMLNYNVNFVNMENILDRRTTQIGLNWSMDVPRLEKGFENEKNYSTVAYRYAGSEDVKSLGLRKDSANESFAANINWFAFQQQFFSAILVADNNFSGGSISNKFYTVDDNKGNLMHSNAEMLVDIDNRSVDFSIPFKFYFGPNHYPTMKGYDLGFEKIIPLGGWLIGSISRYVIIPVFNWLSKSIASYGLIILILTLMLKLVISPLTIKSYTSSAKMRVLKPEIDKINAKYPKQEDALKKQQATMDLYKRAGVSMFGGCLPMLLQFPILFAMFRFFPASIELRQQGFLWASDLSAYDSILDFGFRIPLYGDHISLFALLMGVSMFFYSKMTMAQMAGSQQMPGMKFMQVWFMPIFMVVLCNNFSAGLSYYYMLSNLITIVQTWVIRKWFVDEKKIYAKLKQRTESNQPVKKSKFQQRLDAAYKAQQAQMKNMKR